MNTYAYKNDLDGYRECEADSIPEAYKYFWQWGLKPDIDQIYLAKKMYWYSPEQINRIAKYILPD